MYTLIPLTLLLLWHGLDSNMLQMPEMADILSKARILCPYNSLCEEPPLSAETITSGTIPCCRDCSCRPDCYLRNDCCFPSHGSHTFASECLHPVSPQRNGPVLVGKTVFPMVTDVTTCQTNFPVFSSDTLSTTFTQENYTHTTINPEEVSEKCGKCDCNTASETNSFNNCICNKPTVDENDDCTCGEIKVAPWGSLFPVYSSSSGLIYKNPVCAACHGITDGIIWTPFIRCLHFSLHFIEKILDRAYLESKCTVVFLSPKRLDRSRLQRCASDTRNICSDQVQSVPNGFNMTRNEIQSACNSNFTSTFEGRLQNVFCSFCIGRYSMECIDNFYGIRFGSDSFTVLLKADFLEEKSTKRLDIKQDMACSKSMSLDCRKILCPSGQVRNANGVCVYPMTTTYVDGFRLILRLYPDTPAPVQDIINRLPGKKIKERHLITPWPTTWLKPMTLLETTRLVSSGDVVNTTAFIVAIALPNPDSEVMLVFESVKHVLEEKCFFEVNNVTIALKVEMFEHIKWKNGREKGVMVPVFSTSENEMNMTVPTWIVQWDVKYNPMKFFQPITKLMFCEQVTLNSNEYSLNAKMTLLYYKFEDKFLYDGQFVYDVDGDRSVRLCLDDTGFVKLVSSSQTCLQNVFVCVMFSTFNLCFLIISGIM